MIVYFDVDHTIFNSARFKELVTAEVANRLALGVEEVSAVFQNYRQTLAKSTDFNPVEWQAALVQACHLNQDQAQSVEEIWQTEALYQQAIFEDTLPTLRRLQAAGVSVGIYSEAEENWQRRKLEKSGIMPFIDPNLCLIARRKSTPEVLARLAPNSWVIDDNPEFILGLLTRSDLKVVWIRRPGHQPDQPQNQADLSRAQVVSNLADFATLVINDQT